MARDIWVNAEEENYGARGYFGTLIRGYVCVCAPYVEKTESHKTKTKTRGGHTHTYRLAFTLYAPRIVGPHNLTVTGPPRVIAQFFGFFKHMLDICQVSREHQGGPRYECLISHRGLHGCLLHMR